MRQPGRLGRFSLLYLLAILFLWGSLLPAITLGGTDPPSQEKAPAPSPPPAALVPFLSPKIEELSYVEMPPEASGLWVAAYSYRDKASVPHSRIIVVGSEGAGKKPEMLWGSKEEDLYNPRVILESALAFRGRPLVLVNRQKGAAWEQVDVIGFDNRRPQHLGTQEAERFALAPLPAGAAPVLLAFQRKYVSTLPEVLEWNGEKFVPASQKFPQFYEALVQQGGQVLQDSEYQPLELALLTAMAGKRPEAIQQLEKLLATEQSREAKANRELIQAIEQELNSLKAAQ